MIGRMLGYCKTGEQLGRRGMGEVSGADDLGLNRKATLIFLPDAFTRDPNIPVFLARQYCASWLVDGRELFYLSPNVDDRNVENQAWFPESGSCTIFLRWLQMIWHRNSRHVRTA